MVVFTSHHTFPFPFREVAMGIWHKYPNEHTNHISSVDVIDRSILKDGTLRTERLISIKQNAPRWIIKMIGGTEEQFVREVIFFKPSRNERDGAGPMILMWSINLTVSSIMLCKEKIRYQKPTFSKNYDNNDQLDQKNHSLSNNGAYDNCDNDGLTEFYQVADIRAQGSLATGQTWQGLGRRLELWAKDRFSTNAEIGRQGFTSVLNSLYRRDSIKDHQS
ncbi:PRELI-like family-domain-containing protein [Phakopsora pachyrhizi]|uniref:PRELI-like family-domain-containing protein n=1 Tax=Phakopsora pachyrhizi TaxID=170000 RepID=A0AAV0BRV8_PHAPC|nr:PRELI-like family-domain-containing protein [Phakopsora pachyrhizi]